MSDELNSAMSKIKQVLSHYRAFQEIEKALQVAADSERMVVELGLQAAALKKGIDELESAKATAIEDYKAIVSKAESLLADRVAKMRAEEDKVRAEVQAVEARLEALRVRQEDMERTYSRRAADLGAKIKDLHAAAEDAEERYRMAKEAIVSLKAGL
jgi:chromosome segregation ATPase